MTSQLEATQSLPPLRKYNVPPSPLPSLTQIFQQRDLIPIIQSFSSSLPAFPPPSPPPIRLCYHRYAQRAVLLYFFAKELTEDGKEVGEGEMMEYVKEMEVEGARVYGKSEIHHGADFKSHPNSPSGQVYVSNLQQRRERQTLKVTNRNFSNAPPLSFPFLFSQPPPKRISKKESFSFSLRVE